MDKDITKEYIKKISIMLVIGVFTIGIIYGFEKISQSSESVPKRFQSAYKEASESGQKVINHMNSINKKVENINNLDLQGESQKSLSLIKEAKKETETARNEAKKLSKSLDEIRSLLEGFSESDRVSVVLEAINIEEKLIDEFLTYTDELDNFLNTLSGAIESDSFSDRVEVDERLDSVNEKKKIINSLNSKFISKLQELNEFN